MLEAGYKRRTRNAAAAVVALAGLGLMALLPVDRANAAPTAQASKSITITKRTFHISQRDDKQRLAARCPGNLIPFGGGMQTNPPPGPDGEGAYPHSYERLGVQHGWHSTVVLFDPAGGGTQGRDVTLQAVCGRKGKHVTPPHTTINLSPGQTRTAVATCPGRRHLFGGGFQRTDFISSGGDYVNGSRAISSKSWAVTGSAFGLFGGELTAIAYCRRSKNPLVSEVSGTAQVPSGKYGTAVTPPCPPGTRVVFGGFDSSPAGAMLITDGYINVGNAWTASAFNYFGRGTGTINAFGYCLHA